MISSEPTIALSFTFWSKLKLLSTHQKNKFFFCLQHFINNDNLFTSGFTQSLSEQSIVFLTFPRYCFLISIFKQRNPENVIKIVDCLPNISQNQVVQNLQDDLDIHFTIKNIAVDDLKFAELGELQDSFIDRDYFFRPQNLTTEEDDFWCYFPLPEQKQQYDLLSTQQYRLLNRDRSLPAIVMGDRGTGKTTTAIYSALNQARLSETKTIVFITDSQSSAKTNKKISDPYNQYNNISFLPFLKLSKIIIDKYPLIFTRKFLSQRQINFYKFNEQFFKPKKIFIVKPEQLWQEIKYSIKGSIKLGKGNKYLISYSDYLSQKNQTVLPPDTDFKVIYDLAVQYQEWLESQKYWDELDLTIYLLNQLPDNYLGEYEALYIDGIEKFSEVQTSFLFKLLKIEEPENYYPQLFLVGNQEIKSLRNDLTWNKVKKIIIDSYHKLPQWKKIRTLIEPQEFVYSFNYVDTITNLSATAANLIGKNVRHSSWFKSTQKPLVISEISQEFLDNNLSLNIDCAIVVFSEEEKTKLTNLFPEDNQRIILFSDLDNLDFKQILVWKLLSYTSTEKVSKNLTNEEYNYLRYNLIAICASKAREFIYFYDDYLDDLWINSIFSNLVEIGYQTELELLFDRKYSDEEIINITDKYLAKNSQIAYQIATQIYDRYQQVKGKEKISALLEEVKGNYGKAGDIWNTLGIYEEAINCWKEVDRKLWLAKWSVLNEDEWQKRGNYFEAEKNYDLAKFCFEKANYFEGQLRCLEQNNQWELAGDECQSRNLIAQADKYYQLADKYYKQHQKVSLAIKMWTKLDRWQEVAIIWQKLNQWEKAGNCWQKSGDMEKAALCWQKAEKWVEAQKCWQQLGNWQQLAQSYETQDDWQQAATTWLKINEQEKAAVCYEKANLWNLAEEIWSELGYWGFVGICLQQQEKWSEAARAWAKTNPYELQALCHEKCGNWQQAEKCWFEAKNWSRIILACEKQGKWLEAAESWENLGEWLKAAEAWQQINQTEKAALCYEEGENWHKAAECWYNLHRNDRLAITLEKQQKWELAAQLWEKLTQWREAGKAWHAAQKTEKAALCYEKGEYWVEAEECWRELENWEKVENACKQQGEWQKAAYDWLKSNQIEKAALCYEKCEAWEKASYYWRQCQNWEKYADVCQQLEEWQKAAEAYLKIEETQKAGLCYEKAENWQKAAECWRKLYKWNKLAVVCEKQNRWEEAARSWLIVHEIEKAALCYEQCNLWNKAEECWRKLNNWEKLAVACEKQNQWEEAAQLWCFLEKWHQAAEACLQINDLETAAKYYEKGGYQEQAQKYKVNNPK